MKIRNGFVSNSSSSCYLISFGPKTNVHKLLLETNHSSSCATYIGLDDVVNELKVWFWLDQDDYRTDRQVAKFLKLCGKINKVNKNGREVALLEIENYDEKAYDILNHHDDVKILKSLV